MSTTSVHMSGSPQHENIGPAILIAAYVSLAVSASFVCIRGLAMRWRRCPTLDAPDFLLPIAWFLAAMQTACVHAAVRNGLGRHLSDLTGTDVELYNKSMYAVPAITLLILGLAKVSVALLIKNIEPQKNVLWACYGIIIIISVWTCVAILIVLLQCDLPNPWHHQPGVCMNTVAFYNAIGAIDILTELAVVCLPISLICMFPLPMRKKLFICALFSTRFFIPVFIGVQLQNLHQEFSSHDNTFEFARLQIWTQIIINTSLVTACIPSLGKLVADFVKGVTSKPIPSTDLEMERVSDESYRKSQKLGVSSITSTEVDRTSSYTTPRDKPKKSIGSTLRRCLFGTSKTEQAPVARSSSSHQSHIADMQVAGMQRTGQGLYNTTYAPTRSEPRQNETNSSQSDSRKSSRTAIDTVIYASTPITTNGRQGQNFHDVSDHDQLQHNSKGNLPPKSEQLSAEDEDMWARMAM